MKQEEEIGPDIETWGKPWFYLEMQEYQNPKSQKLNGTLETMYSIIPHYFWNSKNFKERE